MTARVIDDPSDLGWEYDPDTGRWTWGGSSGGGGGGGGSFPEAPVDGKQYGRQNAGWTEIVSTGGGAVTTADVQLTNPTVFAPSGFTTQEDANTYFAGEVEKIISDAPADSGIYGRQNNGWVAVPTGGGGSGGNDPRITDTQISNWDTAFGWGNHASKGYLTSASLSGYATEGWVATNYVSIPTISNYYTKTEADAKFELKGAGGGGGDPFPWTGTTAVFNGTGENPTIQMKAGGGRGPEIQWANNNGHSKYMRLTASGNLELVSSSYGAIIVSFTDSGLIQATDFNATSDANLKDNITTAPQGILYKLKGREWNWKESGEKGSGVVAQELEAAGLDHLVSEDPNGNKTVAYNGLVAYLIEEVKALRDEIEAMK